MKLKLIIADEASIDTMKWKNFVIRKRDTFVLDCFFIDEDDIVINLTGATIFLTVKDKISDVDASAIISKTVTAITDALNGEAEITLSSTDTNVAVGNFIYDVQVKLSSGKIYTVMMGNFCVQSDVTIRTS